VQSACAVLHCCLSPVRLYHIFPTLSHKPNSFGRESYWTSNVCFDFLYNFCQKIPLCEKNWARYYKNIYWPSCKVPVFFFFLSCCTETRIFPIDFRKILISNYTSRQSVQWESRCYVRRDRWTEMTKVSPFAILRMRPKNMQFSLSTPWRNVVGSYGIDPLILHFGTRRVWLTSRYGGKKYRYPSNLRLHCSHGRFGRFSGEIHFSAPSWFEIRSLDSVSTELPSTKLSV